MSTNNINEAEREAFEAWANDTAQGFKSLKGAAPDANSWYYFDQEANDAWHGWKARAALSSTPSNLTEGEISLPEPKYPKMRVLTYGNVGECAGYTAEQVREIIAADRRARQGEPVACLRCDGKGQVRAAYIPGGWAKCGECSDSGRAATKAAAPADEAQQIRQAFLDVPKHYGRAPAEDAREHGELRAALKPFADAYAPEARRHVELGANAELLEFLDGNRITPAVTMGDFRRAYEAFNVAGSEKAQAGEDA